MLRRVIVLTCLLALAAACSSGGSSGPKAKGETAPSETSTTTTAKAPAYPLDDTLRFDQVQVLASHNSYHGAPYPEVLEALRKIDEATAAGLDYGHRPLPEQFDAGVRAIELDVWADPQGGKYAQPSVALAAGAKIPDEPVMLEPGFKVIHEANIDTNSTCLTFVACLGIVKTWSDAHPGHVPMAIQVEVKDMEADVDPAYFDALEAEIRSVFTADDLITPDDVRGSAATLGEAVRTQGWPVLAKARGKVLFLLDNEGYRAVELQGHPSLQGRILFAPSKPGEEDAAFAKENDPVGDAAAIKAALAANMLVRTRADSDTVQARANDTTARDAAFAGGAQIVSTDYEFADPRFAAYGAVSVPGGKPARCNPVTAPPACTPLDVENPAHLANN